MNSEMQKIMEKRRRLAEEKARNGGGDLERSIGDLQISSSDLQNSKSYGSQEQDSGNLQGSKSWDPNASSGSAMSEDLQAIMERRRRLADGGEAEGATSRSSGANAREDLKGVEMSPDLKAIMSKRRLIADSKKAEAAAAASGAASGAPSKQNRRASAGAMVAEVEADLGEIPRNSRRASLSSRVSAHGKSAPAPPTRPSPPPLAEGDADGMSIDSSGESGEGSSGGEEKEVAGKEKSRRSHRTSRPSTSTSNPSSSRKSRPKKEEIIAPVELDIDEDSHDEEEEDEPPPAPAAEAPTPKTRRSRKSQEDPEEVVSPKRKLKLRTSRRPAGADPDDMSIDQSVDQSVDSQVSSRSGSKQSPKKSPSGRSSAKKISSGSSSSRPRESGDRPSRRKSTATGSKSDDDDGRRKSMVAGSRSDEKSTATGSKSDDDDGGRRKSMAAGSRSDEDDGKHKRRASRRKSNDPGRPSGALAPRARSMRKSESSRSVDTDEDGPTGSTPNKSKRHLVRKSSSGSFKTEPIMEDHSLSPQKMAQKKPIMEDHSLSPIKKPIMEDHSLSPAPVPAKSPRKKKEGVVEKPSDSGWGDDQEAGFADGFANFGGNMEASVSDFGTSGFPPPAADKKDIGFPPPAADKKDTSVASTDAFSAAFSADATFDAAFSEQPAFETSTFGGSAAFDSSMGGFDAFSSPPLVAAPVEKVWDSTPLTDIPTIKPSKLSLIQTTTVRCQFQGAPTTNPMNGNTIFCSWKGGALNIHEIDPHKNNVQVSSVAVLSTELQRKLASKYNASAQNVDSVVALTAGLHRAHGQTRVRVAAMLDLRVLESDQAMRIVAVWQWGYGSPHPVLVQHVMTPPSGGDFSYDAASLQVADGLLFIAGTSPKGPCIFMSKPAVRETWSATFLPGKGKISAMAVTPDTKRAFPYLAIALSDRSLSVWTYGAALSSGVSKEASPRWLFPLCRLEGQSVLANVPAMPLSENAPGGKDAKDTGHCTNLAWLPPQPSMSYLQMIAAGYQNGLVVFHVALPVVTDRSAKNGFRLLPEPTAATLLTQTPALKPLVANRWQGKHDRMFVSWINLGPHVNPCLALCLHESDTAGGSAKIVLGSIDVPLYRRGPAPKDRLLPFCILASTSVANTSASFPNGLIHSSDLKAIMYHAGEGVVRLSPSMSSVIPDASVTSLGDPISSNPPGLGSLGDPLLTDADSDKDGILHIFSVLNCERQKSELDASMLDWSRPRRRLWLCRTVVGDSKTSGIEEKKEDQEASEFGGSEAVLGGTSSDVVCELHGDSLTGLAPLKIVRCPGARVCAVLFQQSLGGKSGGKEGLSREAVSIAFIDYSGPDVVMKVIDGRDITFWTNDGDDIPRGLILSRDGSSLTFFTWQGSLEMGKSFRPILGVETGESYIECRRVFVFSGASMLGLVIVGRRQRDGRSCITTGDLCAIADATPDSWSVLLPNIVSGRSVWLDDFEDVFSIVGLECDDSGYRNFALATSSRVLILSSALDITAQTRTVVSCSALAPLGSFAVSFCSNGKLRYLCGLDGDLVTGTIATLPSPRSSYAPNLLLGVRPDRVLVFQWHNGTRLSEPGQSPNSFLLPTAVTQPVLLLEPMIANAVCIGGKLSESTPVLRSVIEKFGRKVASITHGDDEGIGNLGAGVTPQVFEILRKYGLNQAASWLLTGAVQFNRSANSTILPHWLPVAPKARGALNSDGFLHLIANGDQYFSDYIKAPDQNMASTLPRRTDPAAYISQEFARDSLVSGKPFDALKMLDIAGAESTETLILQVALILQNDHSKDVTPILKSLCGYDDNAFSRSTAPVKTPAALAALAVALKLNKSSHEMSVEQVDRWMKPLAPSLQRGTRTGRMRQKILGEEDLAKAGAKQQDSADALWTTPCNESKHVWNEGPRKEKNNLLMLDRVEDWLGRRRPVILGKEGALAAGDRGEKTLADILNNDGDDDSFGGKSDLVSEKDGSWVDGVGEGRTDESNLSGYFRFWEGEDEDSPWRSEGLSDLSPYQNKAVIVGDAEACSLEPTTSNVDEGEPGKVKCLYDLVFKDPNNGAPSGLALSAPRGGSLDVGMLHGQDRPMRQRCTVEFWFYLPSVSEMSGEVVLARRTMGPSADDFSKVCLAPDKESSLWEIVIRRSGELEFRTCGGSSLISSSNYDPGDKDDNEDSDDEKERQDLALFERWNHVCLVFSTKGLGTTKCSVTMLMKGVEAVSSDVSMLPPGYEEDELDSKSKLDDLLEKSHLLFGLNSFAGLRFTELRVWACERSPDDVSAFMYEYLTAAEAKKKFKVKIKNKKGLGGLALSKGSVLAPRAGGLAAPQKGSLAPKFSLAPTQTKSGPAKMSLAPKAPAASLASKAPAAASLIPPSESLAPPKTEPDDFFAVPATATKADENLSFETSFNAFGAEDKAQEEETKQPPPEIPEEEEEEFEPALEVGGPGAEELDEEEVPVSLWDTALPLSQQVRSSAATALIRGPPATRHFGGNRGGLPDFSGVERFGVGGVAICGSEKTIVYRDNEDPPALTYPIGASGAIVSDQMDDEGSEFLCCFLAKDKRMVVFELQSRTVVVELQMTTKLNFWRFLPPEASENTLCFALVTPVGGFHWMPLEESPRPHQVWKRGPELQGKKVVGYEEGGSNGLEGLDILSRVGLVTVTKNSDGGTLEAWLVPICGDSQAVIVFEDVMGACFCQPANMDDGPFLPLVVTAHAEDEGMFVNVLSISEPAEGSINLGNVEATEEVDLTGYEDVDYEAPPLAMGTSPDAICCSLANIVVVIIRRKGLIVAFELEDGDITLIASEDVGHFIVDAVMRYSAEVGGAEVVMLLADNENPKDGRIVSFCFRSAV